MDTMHLFAGIGGGLLADLILGHRPIVAVEWEPYACQVLRERAAEGWFPDLRVWEGDVRMFDPSEYTGKVDCIHAGFPCQDLSVIGKGNGINGSRSSLFSEAIRIANVTRARFIFLENSPAIIKRGIETVMGELSKNGFDARWAVLPASAVGAPHKRERWWCLARRTKFRIKFADDCGLCECCEEPWCEDCGKHYAECGCVGPSEADDLGYEIKEEETGTFAYLPSGRLEGRDGCNTEGHRKSAARSVSAFCESGLWADVSNPYAHGSNDGLAYRMERTKAIGNGQVPLQAAVAWKLLGGP